MNYNYHTVELVLKDANGNESASFKFKASFAKEAVEDLQKYHHGLDIKEEITRALTQELKYQLIECGQLETATKELIDQIVEK